MYIISMWHMGRAHLPVTRTHVRIAHCIGFALAITWHFSLYHILCRWHNESVVECLLTQGHADPNYTTERGSTPLSLTLNTRIIRLLLQHGAEAENLYKYSEFLPDGSPRQGAQSTISVFMVGDKGAGKSTLTKALTTEKEGIARWAAQLSKISDVKEKTAGIECHTIHSSRIGHFTIYDLAGHREFHHAHDTVIRSSISGPSSGMFLFVMDLTTSLDDLKRSVSYWVSFIQSQICMESSTQISKPYLLAVGSHTDSVKSKSELEEKKSLVQSLYKEAENIHFVDCVAIDCRYSESKSLTQLRAHMLNIHDKLQKTIPRVTFHDHCFHVYLISECGNQPGMQPGMQLSSLMRAIKSSPFTSKDFLPQTMEALHKACSNLNKRGVMLYIQAQSIESSWIIIDKDMLLREVNGSIFAPDDFIEHKALTVTGVVPFSKVVAVFKELDPQLIIDFCVHMEFCREITAEDGLKLVTQTHSKHKEECHFLFPALTPQTAPPDLWQPNPNISYSSCWILQCREHHHYLTSRYHQVLLLRLAFSHVFPVESDEVDPTSPALQQACTIWRRGIKWTTPSSVDVLVEMNDDRVVLLLRCARGKELQLVKLRAQVMEEIQSVKREFCSNAVTVERFIPNPQYPVDSKVSVSLNKIAHSVSSHEEAVMLSPHTPLSITKLLFFEPYIFCNPQCLVDLFCGDLVSCKVTPQFIECISSKISCVDDFCTLLNVPLHKIASYSSDYDKAVRMFQEWQAHSEGTYQCLRQHMDKYSVFSGRNILVCCFSVMGCLHY